MRAHGSILALIVAAAASPPAPASADDGVWSFVTEFDGTPEALVRVDDRQLIVGCGKDGMLILYTIPGSSAPAELANVERATLVLTIDDRADGSTTWIPSSLTILHDDRDRDVRWLDIGGKYQTADGEHVLAFARQIGQAKRNVVAAIAIKAPGASDHVRYANQEFPIAGAGDAIKELFSVCGVGQ